MRVSKVILLCVGVAAAHNHTNHSDHSDHSDHTHSSSKNAANLPAQNAYTAGVAGAALAGALAFLIWKKIIQIPKQILSFFFFLYH